ncbi:MAG: pyrrolysine--tRNA(Pyl) ligase large subunit [Lachnospiraceae bacterium]|nr:pyrrolysine--tRNA(Pyl) ligase large subunit [Lachnospiraceae bacterium]
MAYSFSETQKIRLSELGVKKEVREQEFEEKQAAGKSYQKIEKEAVTENKRRIRTLLYETRQPKLCRLQNDLADCLIGHGFTQVATPTILSRKFLERMTIDGTHPLNDQVFWLDQKTCLRPMLAPNLYDVSKRLMNFSKLPLRVFEIGSCFRKESEGRQHLKEFTMLNLVEWGTPIEERNERLKEFSKIVLNAAGIKDFKVEEEESVVYGKGIDIVSPDGLELASTSMGPHPLDDAWNVTCSWVGVGFGLERLLMYREKEEGIHRYSRSLAFLDGARLNIK